MTRTASRSRSTASKKAKRPYVQKPPVDELKFETVEITEPTKLPSQSIVVGENWQNRVEDWDKRLRARGSKIKYPLTLYVYTRVVKTVELHLETEPLEVLKVKLP